MGQIITKSDIKSDISSVAMSASGFLGIFGTGNFKAFFNSDSFVVPPNVSRLRVRVIGAGSNGNAGTTGAGDPANTIGGAGGAGGGYAHAVYTVTPSTSYTVTVATVGTSTT